MKRKIVYALLGLMIATAIVYFIEANEEYTEALEEHEKMENEKELFDKESQAIFFTITGIAYIGVGAWTLKNDRAPYIIVIIGSIVLIVLYAISRVMMFQVVGFVEIGSLGIISKVLQGAIIVLAAYMLKR